MTKTLKKVLSFVLAMVMVLSLIPAVYATETTQPSVGGDVGTRGPAPSKTYDADEWIEVNSAEDLLALTASGTAMDARSINAEANKGKTIGLKLMGDIAIETTSTTPYAGRYAAMYIGHYNSDATKAFPVDVVLDLNGYTLTDTSVNSRMIGIYSGSEFVVTNGTILGNGDYISTGGVFFSSGDNDIILDGISVTAKAYTKEAHGNILNTSGTGAVSIINSYLEVTEGDAMSCRGGMIAIQHAVPVTLKNSTFVGGHA